MSGKRTIPEILGWQKVRAKREVLWRSPNPERFGLWTSPSVTVDAMLAYIQSGPLVHEHWNPEGRIASISPTDDGWEINWYCAAGADGVRGSTLYEACELAVRAVAEETT